MEHTEPARPRLPWRAALKGGFIAVAAPILFGIALSLTSGEAAQEGIGWIFVAAILASPIIFALGAAGGVVAHVARGRPAVANAAPRPALWKRASWILTGAAAGYGASEITGFDWPVIGGALIALALIPVWIWIGVAAGRSVANGQGARRPALGALVVSGAVYAVVRTVVGAARPHINRVQFTLAATFVSAVIGWFVYRRMLERNRPPDAE